MDVVRCPTTTANNTKINEKNVGKELVRLIFSGSPLQNKGKHE